MHPTEPFPIGAEACTALRPNRSEEPVSGTQEVSVLITPFPISGVLILTVAKLWAQRLWLAITHGCIGHATFFAPIAAVACIALIASALRAETSPRPV